MNRFTPERPATVGSLVRALVVGLALVASVPLALWALATPVAAVVSVAAAATAGLLLTGTADGAGDG